MLHKLVSATTNMKMDWLSAIYTFHYIQILANKQTHKTHISRQNSGAAVYLWCCQSILCLLYDFWQLYCCLVHIRSLLPATHSNYISIHHNCFSPQSTHIAQAIIIFASFWLLFSVYPVSFLLKKKYFGVFIYSTIQQWKADRKDMQQRAPSLTQNWAGTFQP